MAEHIGRYAWIIDKLNHDGFHVISKDHLGHGRYIKQGATAGFFNESDGWNSVTNNLGSTIDYAQNKYPNLPSEYWSIMSKYYFKEPFTKKALRNDLKKLKKKGKNKQLEGFKIIHGKFKVEFD